MLSRRDISRRFREKRRLDGICLQCRQPVVLGKDKCQVHLERHRVTAKAFYHSRVSNNLCARCGNPGRISRTYCAACLELERKEYANLKQTVVLGYGGKCECCGETIPEFLTIDHKNNNGAKHRASGGAIGAKLYRFLIKNNFPRDEYQLLCFNCNCGRQVNGGTCPHRQGLCQNGRSFDVPAN